MDQVRMSEELPTIKVSLALPGTRAVASRVEPRPGSASR